MKGRQEFFPPNSCFECVYSPSFKPLLAIPLCINHGLRGENGCKGSFLEKKEGNKSCFQGNRKRMAKRTRPFFKIGFKLENFILLFFPGISGLLYSSLILHFMSPPSLTTSSERKSSLHPEYHQHPFRLSSFSMYILSLHRHPYDRNTSLI